MSITRSALAGLATGGRTFSGIAALTATVPPGTTAEPDATLARTGTQAALALLASGEVVADKLPFAPSRLEFPGIHGRIAFGAVCGVVIARRSARYAPPEPGAPVVPGAPMAPGRPGPVPPAHLVACAAVGAGAAWAGSVLGHRFRGWAASRIGHDWIAAVLEDLAVAGLTSAAVG